jgi:chemotaxis signal transduction protein
VKIGRVERPKPRAIPHGEMMILFNVAAHTLAIAAQAVEEIRNTGGMNSLSVPGVSKVRQVLTREQKTHYIVDAGAHLGVRSSRPTRLLLLREAILGLSVDSIEGMAEVITVHKLPRAFQGAERSWYRGLAIVGRQVVPVINPETLLTQLEWAALRNSTQYAVPSTQKRTAASGQ